MTHLANANGLAREQTIITMARALRAFNGRDVEPVARMYVYALAGVFDMPVEEWLYCDREAQRYDRVYHTRVASLRHIT